MTTQEFRVRATHYIATSESEPRFSGPATSGLYTSGGSLIAMVSRAFAQDLYIEGTGILRDGRIVNVTGTCRFGDAFQSAPGRPFRRVCYHVLDPSIAPWGTGNAGRPIQPLRSIATDHRVIPPGTRVFIQEYAGLEIPTVQSHAGPLGGFTHDGWFTADDAGEAIQGAHIDIFAGNREMLRALSRLRPDDNVTVRFDGPTPRFGAGRGVGTHVSSSSGSGFMLVLAMAAAWIVTRR